MRSLRQLLHVHNPLLDALLAFLACSSAALVLAVSFRGHSNQTLVPILFIGVVSIAAMRWGPLGAIAGVLSSAALFACLLFEPLGRLAVSSPSAKSNLGWMMLFGIILAFFVGRPSKAKTF